MTLDELFRLLEKEHGLTADEDLGGESLEIFTGEFCDLMYDENGNRAGLVLYDQAADLTVRDWQLFKLAARGPQ